jgi:hypothetical protein
MPADFRCSATVVQPWSGRFADGQRRTARVRCVARPAVAYATYCRRHSNRHPRSIADERHYRRKPGSGAADPGAWVDRDAGLANR